MINQPVHKHQVEHKTTHKAKTTSKHVVKKQVIVKPVQQAPKPVQQVQQPVQKQAPVQQPKPVQKQVSAPQSSAGNQIAKAESGGSYTAQNGKYYGRYQLDISYLHGDLSPQNQERTFVKYCNSRYGSVQNALSFRQSHNWY